MIIAAIAFFSLITISAPLLGKYIAVVYKYGYAEHEILKQQQGRWTSQSWHEYFASLMYFNSLCILSTFCIIYFQDSLPTANDLPINISFSNALNAAVSFSTGTFWQSHNPESELTMLSHVFALIAQNFLSGATGIAVFVAFIRGIINSRNPFIGNFYDDFLRAFLFILLPFSIITAIALISMGMPHDFIGNINYTDLSGVAENLTLGPVAGQVAIKNLVANGGSLFASASAHPFEAPTRGAIMLSLFLIVVMPSAMIFTYGFLVDAQKLSWALYTIIVIIMISSLLVMNLGETTYGIPFIFGDTELGDNFNYTGKEMIYDKFPSLMWVLSITMSSDGSANACLENYSPLSTLVLFSNLIMSKFVIEGVGSGFFAMLSYLIVAVFLRGLITGEAANFFGKRITINEINYVIIVFLVMPVGVLLFTGITLLLPYSQDLITYHGSQAVTDITYNFASSFANNGSDFAGIDISSNYFNYMTALAMFLGRYPIIYFSLAISGSFACKQRITSEVNQRTQSSIELSFFLLVTVLLVGAIMFLPLMILGPLLEFINM
ncbi:MAG: potassium-transporting ATPase subunit KdpA [Rickettsiaceae bacterium]|nr:potassium-transporting ATPase subunit KdpA [Rickettsiaceae bacterium]MDP4832172.1 potassium-transporting ATPase subunit KdpA [Rickettsiaceae bacterium]MDP5020856.1 potassium-transporting ATPase subunit KdpA [Rickettsiaceae bacterium]MDP5083422.1 potassium-transporting ATPase subunit KdpA [Rickettsiaceae bacterium]